MLYPNKRPGRLHHGVPTWLDPSDSVYHIRLRLHHESPHPLTEPVLARRLLESAVFYGRHHRWWPHLLLIMPDHVHALLSFPPDESMSRVITDWKRWHARSGLVKWQEGFFDHRLRREENVEHTINYIRNNPVVRGLCPTIEDWPWRINSQDVINARLSQGET
jgi:hypothetical protein